MSDIVTVSTIFCFSMVTWAVLTHDIITGTGGFISAIAVGVMSLVFYGKYLSMQKSEVQA